MATTTNTQIIHASREQVYKAFTDKEALEHWLAPDNMTGKIHNFDLRVGGGYTMSLFYNDNTAGKTSENEDRSTSRFVELKPNERIVTAINFETDNAGFSGEMVMEVSLKEAESNSTKVTIVFQNIPSGIKPEDNEKGTAQSLKKLARYVEEGKKNNLLGIL